MEYDKLLETVGDVPVFESSLLMSGDVDPNKIRVQLSRWVRSGKILQLRRGLYSIAPPYQKILPHPFFIANHLQKASYVSFQSALSYYNLIPEIVNTTTSVSTGRPERLNTPFGIFEFRHIKKDLLFGYHLVDLGSQSAFVATPEKALLDLIYFQSGGESIQYLEELRVQNADMLDFDLLSRYSNIFNSHKMNKAIANLSKIISDEVNAYEDL